MLPRASLVEANDARYLLFSTTDLISNSLFRTGHWEQHLLQLSAFILRGVEKPLVIDIGANLGAYSIPLAQKIQALGGQVIGFEPQRIVFYQLCANVILNRLQNYHAIYSAVGEVAGAIDIPEIDYENNRNIGAFSLDKRYRERHGIEAAIKPQTVKVPQISLDDFECDKAPTLIKIDVEGFELSVLKGATAFLSRHQYPPILFEAWNADWFKHDKEVLMSFVRQLGYEITAIGKTDYIAQHPQNPIKVALSTNDQGVTIMQKIK